MRTWESYTLADLPVVAKEMIESLQGAPRVWLFRGQMGAGKTTLSKELLLQLGVGQNVQSPTFSLVNEYQTKTGEIIYHFDLYRLKNIQEALAIGIEEYLDSGNYCLIEWPEQAEELWDFPHVNVEIEAINEVQRKLTLSC
ncbi:tRNA (adenosine(37)-N6)-threonylcarbamoyltransferase complex ATPase subunit type 1 TsaE [Aquirufa regiilacus]|jgi:tRNA threonylcarbamoyladenosine biosynthesis protein TsaE|uniref:tRNA threonylcarbamoyladenosine biosynthesis protein TsaE n=1 Tax=Aquirufa regiilacus TaxID=3024868 RepID=A0ABU3TUP2_9BACT|nr:tRNA (adenosine(37)-N6)-threonylcarbamoyltransferase complex ATPase subunit type 1 TsaE [Aquirufa sp. LEOWEIH-7C]MDU0809582.1 tRNA (adenosine(37)-N6)-threonylcarbamoyltransferase complex ATPase subunit type 1 TsaE [Aquirufa sp. LEOWEIH-7C]